MQWTDSPLSSIGDLCAPIVSVYTHERVSQVYALDRTCRSVPRSLSRPFSAHDETQAFALFALAICAPEKDGTEGIVSPFERRSSTGADVLVQWIGLSVSYSLLATAFVQLYLVGHI